MEMNWHPTLRQTQALACLREAGPAGVTTDILVDKFGMTRDAASGTLQRMFKHGYIQKRLETSPAGRVNSIFYIEDEPVPDEGVTGYDEGWLAGYEEGRAANADAATAHALGKEEGIALGSRLLGSDVVTLIQRMQHEIKQPVHVRTKTCWMVHPACALVSVRKLVEQEIGLVEKPIG